MDNKNVMGILVVSTPWWWWRRASRATKTVFFVFSMIGSLLLFSAPPLLVAILDIVLPTVLLNLCSSVGTVSVASILTDLRIYDLKSSVVDVPLLSIARSLLILCVYSLCDEPGRSRGPYLFVTMLCSMASAAYVTVKAFVVFNLGVVRWRWSFDRSSGLELMMLTSLLMSIAHAVVAYKTSCRERRKLIVYRIDLEAILPIVAQSGEKKQQNRLFYWIVGVATTTHVLLVATISKGIDRDQNTSPVGESDRNP